MAESQPTHEQWRPIPGHPGYEASSLGRIRSIDRVVTNVHGHSQRRRGCILKPDSSPKGHMSVNLGRKLGKRYVHRLVALAFIGDLPGGILVRHLNDMPADNRVENLAIGDTSDNHHDAVKNGRHAMANRTHCPRGHVYDAANTYIIPGSGSRACRRCAKTAGRSAYVASQPEGWEPRKMRDEITHCPYGHPYTIENTYVIPKTGSHMCKQCRRRRSREYAERRKRAAKK